MEKIPNTIPHGCSSMFKTTLVLGVAFVAWSLGSIDDPCFAQVPRATDGPLPLSPLESQRTFRLPSGFRMELVASEPLIQEPTGVCWDEQGQLFVCEMHGYNLEGQFDIDELNQTGQLDRVVRRIQASEKHKQAAEKETYGTIKLLKDTDGDGRIDSASIWADRLQPCLGICPANGGLIATGQTEIVFLADRDRDGRAELREVLFSGFGPGALERTINAPQWGLDHWIYVGRGTSGGTIRGPHLKKPVELPNTDFRIRSDGSELEPVLGSTKTIGFAMDLAGDRMVVSTRQPGIFVAPMQWKDLSRNPYVVAPAMEWSMTNDSVVHPISQPHPWRIQRAGDPGFSKYYTDRYGLAESAPNGYLTSGCSPFVYRDHVLPGLYGQLFCCEPAQNLVFRGLIDPKGIRPTLSRSPEDGQREFLCSLDSWFHAISLAHAPDGTIYVVDFYREIIEDYSAIPRYLQQQYGLTHGSDRGRIWKLTHETVQPNLLSTNLASLSNTKLVKELASQLAWRRDTARRMLVERKALEQTSEIRSLLQSSSEESVVLGALHTLKSMDSILPADVLWASRSPFASIRRFSLRNMNANMLERDDIRARAIDLTTDESQLVQFQSAISLGDSTDVRIIRILVQNCSKWGVDDWFASALISGTTTNALDWVRELLKQESVLQDDGKKRILGGILVSIGAEGKTQNLETVLHQIEAEVSDVTLQAFVAEQLLSGLKRNKSGVAESLRGMEAVGKLMQNSDERVQRLVTEIAALLKWTSSPAFRPLLEEALRKAVDPGQDEAARVAALRLIALSDIKWNSELLSLLNPRESRSIQMAAIEAIGSRIDSLPLDQLLAKQNSLSPEIQARVVDMFFSTRDRPRMLLDAIENNQVSRNDIPSLRKAQMLEHTNQEIRDRARKIFSQQSNADRSEVVERYRHALNASSDLAKGKELFGKLCSRCHLLNGQGADIGPDLDSVRTRPTDSLLLDILDPSGNINPKYRTFTVLTTDGRIASGLLSEETATSIKLVQDKDKQEVILRRDIEEMKSSSKSIMPEEIEKFISLSEMNDLLSYLRNQLPLLESRRILFDDEENFLKVLQQGNATVRLDEKDRFSGVVSMHLNKGQRYNPSITGWEFSIVENPKRENEYRYLRFAWKTTGNGVMIELAANGKWPSPNLAERRYFSGKNLSPWKATRVDESNPVDWTVVTVDLWRDFGAFRLTGIAPTCFDAESWFDRIELLRSLD